MPIASLSTMNLRRRRVSIEHDRRLPESADSLHWRVIAYEYRTLNGMPVNMQEDTLCVGNLEDCAMCATLFLSRMRGF